MDITTQSVVDTAAIHVRNAAGEPLYSDAAERQKPVRIIIHGPGTKSYAAIEARQSARAVKRMQDNDGKITVATPEERIKETAEDLAAITLRFENLSYPPAGDAQGADLFEAVYLDQGLGFIPRQVAKFLADWGNFKPGSAGR